MPARAAALSRIVGRSICCGTVYAGTRGSSAASVMLVIRKALLRQNTQPHDDGDLLAESEYSFTLRLAHSLSHPKGQGLTSPRPRPLILHVSGSIGHRLPLKELPTVQQ